MYIFIKKCSSYNRFWPVLLKKTPLYFSLPCVNNNHRQLCMFYDNNDHQFLNLFNIV